MAYTDKELQLATQIAYMNITDEMLKKYVDNNQRYPTLKELLNGEYGEAIYEHFMGKFNEDLSELEEERKQSATEFLNSIKDGTSVCSSWKVVNVLNKNEDTGFYACTVETNEDKAIIAYRGSESIDTNQVIKDWVLADFGLINELTAQQIDATNYMNEIQDTLSYKEYAVTGHSLGGNLAAHAYITAPADLYEKISQCVSFDGPGFSNEYLSLHDKLLEERASGITHYQWSLVGSLLSQHRYINDIVIRTTDNVYLESGMQKHDTCFIDFDTNGNVKEGYKDAISVIASMLSEAVDNANNGIDLIASKNEFYEFLDTLEEYAGYIKKFYDSADEVITIDNWIHGWNIIFGNATTARVNVDPLLLDIDNDGYSINDKENGVYFDLDNNGFAEKVNWTTTDGFLALDLNGNNIIDNGSELFGDKMYLSNGNLARNGFEALAQYDTNNDGVIDENDEIFEHLLIWVDGNGNGKSDEGELKTLRELNITSINLNYSEQSIKTDSEATIGNYASFNYNDGTTGTISQIWLESNLYDTVEISSVDLTNELLSLPNVRSIGNVHSLRTAIAMDDTGRLKGLVELFVNTGEISERKEIVQQILCFLTGAIDVEPGSRGTNVDAQQLAVIEAFMGKTFSGQNGANPNSVAGPIVESLYQQILNDYYIELEKQTHLKPYIELLYKSESGEYKTNLVNLYLYAQIESGQVKPEFLSEIATIFTTNAFNTNGDYKVFYDFKSYFLNKDVSFLEYIDDGPRSSLKGTINNDSLSGTSGSNLILGSSGNDTLRGGNGDDILDGGTGDDILYGENGNDTYIYGLGYGNDKIYDSYGMNKVKFLEGITVENISAVKQNDDLVLTINGSETLTIQSYFYLPSNRNFSYEFSDGTVYGNELISNVLGINGTEENDSITSITNDDAHIYGYGGNDTLTGAYGNDTIYGGAGDDSINGGYGDDILYGEEGNDTLRGGNGDDILDGGTGDDILYGENGNDTYIYGLGYGNDKIYDSYGMNKVKFLEGITVENISAVKQNDDLVLTINGSETLTIQSYFYLPSNRNFSYEFSDGKTGIYDMDTSKIIIDKSKNSVYDNVIEDNANILSQMYEENDVISELSSVVDDTIIMNSTDNASITEKTDEFLTQSDIQVIILTENMSAFAVEDNVSNTINIPDVTEDTTIIKQMFVENQI